MVDVEGVLTESVDAHAYWRKLKQRLKAEGNESVTNCHALKMEAADGKHPDEKTSGCFAYESWDLFFCSIFHLPKRPSPTIATAKKIPKASLD